MVLDRIKHASFRFCGGTRASSVACTCALTRSVWGANRFPYQGTCSHSSGCATHRTRTQLESGFLCNRISHQPHSVPLPRNFDVYTLESTGSIFCQLSIHSQFCIGQLCQADGNRPYHPSFRTQTPELSFSRAHNSTTLGKRDSIQRLSGQIYHPDRPPSPCGPRHPCIFWCPRRGGRPRKHQAMNCRNLLIFTSRCHSS